MRCVRSQQRPPQWPLPCTDRTRAVPLLLSQVAALDNMTTALGYMEYAAEVSIAAGRDCLLHSVLGGMAMNVGGTFMRHFITHGYEQGVLKIPNLVPIVRTSTLCTMLYYALSLQQRTAANFEAVRAANGAAWQIVTWLAVACNSVPLFQRMHLGLWDAVTDALTMIARLLGARNHEKKTLGLKVPSLANSAAEDTGCEGCASGNHGHGHGHGSGGGNHGHGHGHGGGGDSDHGHGHGGRGGGGGHGHGKTESKGPPPIPKEIASPPAPAPAPAAAPPAGEPAAAAAAAATTAE